MGAFAGSSLQDVAQLIQLAVVPIFLLSAVATTMIVLLGRLARIVDRGRFLEDQPAPQVEAHSAELKILERRARIIYRSIFLAVTAAILVCLVMTCAFLGELFNFNPAYPVAFLFIAALISYTGALMTLLREVFLAISKFRLGIKQTA